MRVLLLNPPYQRPLMRDTFHPTAKAALYVWHPIDLLIQSGRLSDCELRIHDGVVDNRESALLRLLDEFRPEAVLSLISEPSLESDLRWLREIKRRGALAVFVCGDVTYGLRERFLERHEFLDGILVDFVSDGFARFIRGEPVRNAAWRSDGALHTDWSRTPLDYGRPRHELLRLSEYYLPYWQPPFASVYTAHGCSSNCSFCPVPAMGTPRLRETSAVLEEIDFLRSLGVRKVFFRDASFNVSPPAMLRLCRELERRPAGLRYTAWFRPTNVTAETARALKRSGCQYLHLGVETGSAELLRRLGKDFALEQAAQAVELLRREGIGVIGHFMLAVPGESEQDYRLSLEYLRTTRLDIVTISVFEHGHGVRLEPDESARQAEGKLRRKLLRLMWAFYGRPRRWPRLLRFIEGPRHLTTTIWRTLCYLFGLRLYPRFGTLK